MTRFPDIDIIVGRYVQAQQIFITEMTALVRGVPSAPQRRANLRKRLLNLIRNSEISASMHPLVESLLALDEVGIDLDAIERDVMRHEEM